MTSTRRARSFRFLLAALLTLFGISVLARAPSQALARDAAWHVEVGFNGRLVGGLGALSDAIDPGGAADVDIHLVRPTGGLGARFESGFGGLRNRDAHVLGTSFLADAPTPQPVAFEQSLVWWAVGPSWSFPLPRGRADVYVLAGSASIDRSVDAGHHDYIDFPPTWVYGLPAGGQSAAVPIVVAGTSWSGGRLPVWRFAFGAEIGAELQLAGTGEIWDDPPVSFDGSHYSSKTRSVSMNAAALRLGVNFLGWL